jgi:tRNA (guanine37-N1)-methyltransferase
MADPLRFEVCTLFPEMFPAVLGASILGRAQAAGAVAIGVHNIRDHAHNKHHKVDDKPYGGGPGMVLTCDPVVRCVESLVGPAGERADGVRVVMLTPAGRRFTQPVAAEFAESATRIVLVCGRYEGFDERIPDVLGAEELSIGDVVISGGEIAAMLVVDAVTRLRPGALGHDTGADFESFDATMGLLDYPVYTRPPVYRGRPVPDVLVSGDHEAVAAWRTATAIERTRQRRPDLLADAGADAATAEGIDATDLVRAARAQAARLAQEQRRRRRGETGRPTDDTA